MDVQRIPDPPGMTRRTLLRSAAAASAVALLGTRAIPALVGPASTRPIQEFAPAGSQRPALEFARSELQASLGGPYESALDNLLGINAVPYNPSVYNRTGLMTDPPGLFFRAGGGYQQPWTRDASINTWNAGALLAPAVARNTLWSVCERRPGGGLVVQQDNQWWDQAIWAVAAWAYFSATGDRAFLPDAYETVTGTLDIARAQHYDPARGLYQGPAVMQDGIAGYPSPPYEPGNTSSFVLDYPGSDRLECLSTNCVYVGAHRSAGRLARELGRPQREIHAHFVAARELAQRVNEHLWIREAGLYGYFLHGSGDAAGTLDPHEESLGLALAVLFEVAGRPQVARLLDAHHIQPQGAQSVWPHFDRFSDERPGRHEVIVWPMIQGFWAHAAARGGRLDLFAREMQHLASLVRGSTGKFYEVYNSISGEPDGGYQVGYHWPSQPNQTWSATAYLRMVYSGLFGMSFTSEGLELAPSLPGGWGPVSLRGLRYREATLSLTLRGEGNRIRRMTLDGRHLGRPIVPASLTGSHEISAELGGVL